MGIMKTELKLLPHLETKPSGQPQEFQARQPGEAAGQGRCFLLAESLASTSPNPYARTVCEKPGGTTPERKQGREGETSCLACVCCMLCGGGSHFLPLKSLQVNTVSSLQIRTPENLIHFALK